MKNTDQTLQNNLRVVSNLSPLPIWQHLATFSVIPRPSGEEVQIVDHLQKIAEVKKLEIVARDQLHNLLVRLPATPGLEHLPWLGLQAHTDIVCVKDENVESVFPIELRYENGWVTANGTTLGTDNTIGVAYMTELMIDSNIPHGPIELLFTTIEETGLVGASKFDYSLMKSNRIINLDSEEAGEIIIGCAGGYRMDGYFDPVLTSCQTLKLDKYEIKVSGLAGGHSGLEIHLQRGNAIKILQEVLSKLIENDIPYKLSDFSGGVTHNVIPFEATATILIKKQHVEAFRATFQKIASELFQAYQSEGQNAGLTFASTELEIDRMHDKNLVFTKESQHILLQLIHDLAHGVTSWESEVNKTPETSTNLAMIEMTGMDKPVVRFTMLHRSTSQSELTGLGILTNSRFKAIGGSTGVTSSYAPWDPQPGTALLAKTAFKFEEIFGKKPKIKSIHAGLEASCIYLAMKKLGRDVEIVSIGPTIHDAHKTTERVKVDTVEGCWILLLSLIGG